MAFYASILLAILVLQAGHIYISSLPHRVLYQVLCALLHPLHTRLQPTVQPYDIRMPCGKRFLLLMGELFETYQECVVSPKIWLIFV